MLSLQETTTRNLVFHVKEIADLYALKTLYDYLDQKRKEDSLDVRVFFGGSIDSARSREILQNAPTKDQLQSASIDAVVSCYSDISCGGDLEVDVCILKSAVVPMSKEKKAELKEKYGVKSDEPVLVIGHAFSSNEVTKVVEAASKYATVYLVGHQKKDEYNLSPEAKAKVRVIIKYGVLKDYYAMADVAINAANLQDSSSPLHNFVEATEGGRLFMIPSSNLAQYGYRQLVKAGVIVECNDLDELVSRVQASLSDFAGNERVLEARARHLMQTRANYLPVILAKIMQQIGEDIDVPDSDLNITQRGKRVRILHPDSNWGVEHSMNEVDTPEEINLTQIIKTNENTPIISSNYKIARIHEINFENNSTPKRIKMNHPDSKWALEHLMGKVLIEKKILSANKNPFFNMEEGLIAYKQMSPKNSL